MAGPWKMARSVGLFVLKQGARPAVLVRSRIPDGEFQRPHSFGLGPDEDPRSRILLTLSECGLKVNENDPRSLDLKMVYYNKEVRHDEHLFAVEVPPRLKAPKGFRWVTPKTAFRSFLLSGHKRAMMGLFPKVLGKDFWALDHVPVKHPSGIVVICDFDGTVTDKEASLAILRRFAPGRWERYEKPWLERKISTHDCLGYQFTMMDASVEEMSRFAAGEISLRNGFKKFVTWCRKKGIGLVISSAGVEFYIRAILKKNGLVDVSYIADRNHWVEGIGHIAEEGLYNADCDWCGNCKLELIKLYRSRGAKVVYVGDGKTDECPCAHADEIFARAGLRDFCAREKIDNCMPFETFDDVKRGIEIRYEK